MQTIITLWSPGSYGDQARQVILPQSRALYVPKNPDIVRKVVEENRVWIIPVSNPYWWEVWDAWSTLEDYRWDIIIAGSHILTLDHSVVQRIGDVWKQIRTIISHPQAYRQSEVALQKLYPGHTFVPSDSTIGAPSIIQGSSEAAICSAAGLKANPELRDSYQIVREQISPTDNATKFVVIATRESLWEVIDLPPSEVDILRVALEDKPLQFALKLLAIGQIGGNIHEWSKAKANPGISSLYTALLITSRLPREICTPAWFETMGIEPIPQKEEI